MADMDAIAKMADAIEALTKGTSSDRFLTYPPRLRVGQWRDIVQALRAYTNQPDAGNDVRTAVAEAIFSDPGNGNLNELSDVIADRVFGVLRAAGWGPRSASADVDEAALFAARKIMTLIETARATPSDWPDGRLKAAIQCRLIDLLNQANAKGGDA